MSRSARNQELCLTRPVRAPGLQPVGRVPRPGGTGPWSRCILWELIALLSLRSGLVAFADGAAAAVPPHPPLPLTNAVGVHSLPPEIAAGRLPVRMEAVVTHYHRQLGYGLCVQDATDGVYVNLRGLKPEVEPGDRLRIEGETGAGDYAPVILASRLEKLGRGELPPPEPVSAAALATGRYDSRRVELAGVVRSAVPGFRTEQAHLAIELRSGGHDVLIRVDAYQAASTNLVDAEVIVRGVAAGVFSWQRQLLAPIVVVESDRDLEVVTPARPVETLPVVTIRSLFHYAPGGFPQHRVRLRGHLIGRHAGRRLAVRDATSGLFVEVLEGEALSPGDEVELFGFPQMRENSLWLTRAVLRKLGAGPPPTPVAGSLPGALQHPCELQRLRGVLVSRPRPGEGSWVLTLRQDESEFEAWLPAAAATYPAWLREGAELAVTGVTEPVVLPSQRSTMASFPQHLRLHARTLADIELLRVPPWWRSPQLTATVVGGLLGTLVLLGLTSLTAVVLARKNAALRTAREELRLARDRLAERFSARTGEWHEELTARHAAEADFALLTAERTRLARDLHDTLEQTLASTALQLDAARGFFREQPEESERLLVAATEQLRESQSEVRRSIWNLRSVKLEEATLPDALQQMGKALQDTSGPTVEVRCAGVPVHVPPGVASHLFRVAQEGVTNALKHAGAARIEIRLQFSPEGVELCVGDDGRGFDPSAPSPDGRFGLRGVRERALALEAELEIVSAPGSGTRLRLKVPAAVLRAS